METTTPKLFERIGRLEVENDMLRDMVTGLQAQLAEAKAALVTEAAKGKKK